MRDACATAMLLVLALALMASLPATAGMLEAYRAVRPEAGNAAQCVQIAYKAA